MDTRVHVHKSIHALAFVPCCRKQTKGHSESELQETATAVETQHAGETSQTLMEASMQREQARKREEERERREVAESRLRAMLELKQSIGASKASLHSVHLGALF